MKRFLALILTVLLLGTLIGCSGESNQKDNNSTNTSNPQSQNSQSENNNNQPTGTNGETEDISPENWGASARWVAVKSGANAWETNPFYVNFPRYVGYTEGNGLVAEQLDGTVVIVAAEYEDSPTIKELEEFMPAYSNDLIYTLESIFGIMSKNFQFNIETEEAITVGSYSMHTFNGKFSFDDDGKHKEHQFAVYATQLKSNGAYAYWVVYDVSDNQSNGQLIAEHALNMAKTFREEQ